MTFRIFKSSRPLLLCTFAALVFSSPASLGAEAATAIPAILSKPSNQVIPGKMVWADLLTRDVTTAGRFYAAVLGWQLVPSEDPGYVTAYIDGQPVAALATYTETAPEDAALWLPSFSVRDVDAAVLRALDQGAEELANADDLPNRGRLAVLQDPQGAAFSVLRASSGDPIDGGKPLAGAWIWPELWSSDQQNATDFYRHALELESVNFTDESGTKHQVLGLNNIGRSTVIVAPLDNVKPSWLLYLLVDRMEPTLALVRQHGGKVLLNTRKGELNHRIAIIADPTGGVLALQEMKGVQQ
ncbi:MAG: VOC family protein [Pseudomonadales bacterium]